MKSELKKKSNFEKEYANFLKLVEKNFNFKIEEELFFKILIQAYLLYNSNIPESFYGVWISPKLNKIYVEAVCELLDFKFASSREKKHFEVGFFISFHNTKEIFLKNLEDRKDFYSKEWLSDVLKLLDYSKLFLSHPLIAKTVTTAYLIGDTSNSLKLQSFIVGGKKAARKYSLIYGLCDFLLEVYPNSTLSELTDHIFTLFQNIVKDEVSDIPAIFFKEDQVVSEMFPKSKLKKYIKDNICPYKEWR